MILVMIEWRRSRIVHRNRDVFDLGACYVEIVDFITEYITE